MHLYKNRKQRIAGDRPQGVNIPVCSRRLIKCVSGDTLMFTANVVVPSTGEPLKEKDLPGVGVYVAVAENRFTPVIWAGSLVDGWIVLDQYRPGLVHITIPRTIMNVLRRGSYSFSVVVDDGIVRETQLVGNFQIEYEPTGSINDIPYRHDQKSGKPVSLTPEIDLAAQDRNRLTHDQLVRAVDGISKTLLGSADLASAVYGEVDYEPTEAEVEYAIHRLSQLIVYDDTLRSKIPSIICGDYDPTYDEYVERVCALLADRGIGWAKLPCGGGANSHGD